MLLFLTHARLLPKWSCFGNVSPVPLGVSIALGEQQASGSRGRSTLTKKNLTVPGCWTALVSAVVHRWITTCSAPESNPNLLPSGVSELLPTVSQQLCFDRLTRSGLSLQLEVLLTYNCLFAAFSIWTRLRDPYASPFQAKCIANVNN